MDPFVDLLIKMPFGILFMFIHFRIMGIKQLSQSNAFEFAFVLILASLAWDMTITPEFKLWQMLVVNILLGIIFWTIDWITAKSKKWEKRINGEPQILIKNGQLNTDLCKKERISTSDLNSRLRVLGVFDIGEVELAYLEVGGQISIKLQESSKSS